MKKSSWIIRDYAQEDLDPVLMVWQEASAQAHAFLPPAYLAGGKRAIKDIYLAQGRAWVAGDQGRILGFICLMEDVIGALFVAPQDQARGVGRALVERAGVNKPELKVSVYARNQDALAFYQALGFIPTGTSAHPPTGEVLINLVGKPR